MVPLLRIVLLSGKLPTVTALSDSVRLKSKDDELYAIMGVLNTEKHPYAPSYGFVFKNPLSLMSAGMTLVQPEAPLKAYVDR
jgi:hypothetical protein